MAPLPQPRTEHSSTAADGRIYITGGFAGDGGTTVLPQQLYIYDVAANSWSTGAPIPAARHHAPLVAHDGKLYLIGGYSEVEFDNWFAHPTLHIYDIASNTWSVGPSLPEARGAHAATVTPDGVIHVFGGMVHHDEVAGTHFAFSIAAGTWSTLPPLPTPREHLGAAYLDGSIYVVGGRHATSSALTTVEAFNLAEQSWQTMPGMPTGRSGIGVTVFQGQLYVFGGESFNPLQTFSAAERFHPGDQIWEVVRGMPTARHGLGAEAVGEAIYVIGGGPQANISFSGANDRWTP